MTRQPAGSIRLRGVRHNNLKNFDLDLPAGRLIVITGLSGSGKSSLAFDTLFAEGQRRYVETFSPYARQFFDRMDKPQVDRIEGIPPAIAIEQRNAVRSTRSTIGTMTELCDYMKVVWSHLARLHCRQCGQPVRKEPPQLVWKEVCAAWANASTKSAPPGSGPGVPEVLITFNLPLSDKLSLPESFALIEKQGYQRALIGAQIVRIDELLLEKSPVAPRIGSHLTVVQDRVRLAPAQRARFTEACEQAYHFGKGKLTVHSLAGSDRPAKVFSSGFHCATCDLDYREPTPALFSFNHPVGACPNCKGFGRIITIDYDLALPDRSRTLAGGVVKPWQTGTGAESQTDLMKFCRASGIPTDVPFELLLPKDQDWVIQGDANYGIDEDHQWPRLWYGVKGYFRWLESKAYKMHVRVLLSRYRAYHLCPECHGRRLKPEALQYQIEIPARDSSPTARPEARPSKLNLAEFYTLPVDRALAAVEGLARQHAPKPGDALSLVLNEVRARLAYLDEVGLGYLTLDRPTRTLSGGETERVNLTTCLGTRLVNTMFVLDEPSVGLHPRDTARLVRILERLRDTGNTVVVVEHEASVMRAADQIVDLGPGSGEKGGHIVFQGPFPALLKHDQSLTGRYLSGRTRIELPERRRVSASAPGSTVPAGVLAEASMPYRAGAPTEAGWLRLVGANLHNLKDLAVEIPLHRFVCLTGVSGSGKTTLTRDVLLPALQARLKTAAAAVGKASGRLGAETETEAEDDETEDDSAKPPRAMLRLEGWETLREVVLVDQSPLGKTPRSNPVVYIGAFDAIRDLFAQTDLAKQRGLNGSAFSFNSGVGQCERCRGAGFEKIEMQFLSDVFIRCPDCNGRRYRGHILEVKLRGGSATGDPAAPARKAGIGARSWSIADMLEATVDDALEFLMNFIHVPAGRRALSSLKLLQEVGLGYLRLGQPINTLSGGESQRLKLVRYLAESAAATPESSPAKAKPAPSRIPAPAPARGSFFVFDEPTTGLHFEDVRVLLETFQRLVQSGNSLLVIEHNLEVIKCADWVIDLGPEAGEGGGNIVAVGTPEQIAGCRESHTGQALLTVGVQAIAAGKRQRR